MNVIYSANTKKCINEKIKITGNIRMMKKNEKE